ncbi:A.superbus venom factor 1-like [Glandiceps talaboti]
MANLQLSACLVAMLMVAVTYSQNQPTYFITAPNAFRLGVEETVSITVFSVNAPVTVELSIQDYPDRQKTFSQVQGVFNRDEPGILKVEVNSDDLPERASHEELLRKQYVYLVAESKVGPFTFKQEKRILVSYKSGYVFIQTDKPIYTPEQEVKMRIMPLNHRMRPTLDKIRLEIANPHGTIVERRDDLTSETGIIVETFLFPLFPIFGNWSAVIRFGAEYALNSTVEFEVKEYVLPTYSIKIHPPEYILPQQDVIEGTVEAEYVYGKPVTGSLYLKFGVYVENNLVRVVKTISSGIREGLGFFEFDSDDLGENWFEENEGQRLFISATITEDATGLMENTTDNSAVFSKSPYKFNFEDTVQYFKPGLPYEIKIKTLFRNGKPAKQVPIRIAAKGSNDGGEYDLLGAQGDPDNAVSNHKGEVSFRLDVPRNTQNVRITARTQDEDLTDEQNAEAVFSAEPYQTPSGSFLLVRVPVQQIFVDENIQAEALATAADITKLNYYVITRGKITFQSTVVKEVGVITTLTFQVTPEMSPSSRLVVYYINNQNEVVADSVWLDIEDVCENRLMVNGDREEHEPGNEAIISVDGHPNSHVGLLAVDTAVYLLNDAYVLTAQKMFQRMDKFDLGCGPGGGRDSKQVFEDMGLMVSTNANMNTDHREALGCEVAAVAKKRRRRDLTAIVHEYGGKSRSICEQAQEISEEDLDCEAKKERFIAEQRRKFQEISVNINNLVQEYGAVFLRCCKHRFERISRGRIGGFEDEWTNPDNIIEDEAEYQVRSDFPETWIFEDVQLDQFGRYDLDVTVPSSLTKWIIQAVGISPETGMCVAEPYEMTSFKNFFVALNMPYSVRRGEQIEIRAAVFNYMDNDIVVRAYLYGVEGICAGARPGERSERKQFIVPANDATSITFPVIPLEVGEFPIRISAFSTAGGDIVEKLLKVMPEGEERVFTHSITLDPAGQMCEDENGQCGQPVNGEAGNFQGDEFRDKENQNQINVVDINLPPDAVPGSQKCSVNIMGSVMGPTVTTVIEKGSLHGLLRQPTGCGEQTLLGLAPDIYVLLYLTRTDQVTPDIEKKGYKFVRDGYNRQLTFRDKNTGCFSVWAGRACSTWLTAFTMKIFCQAKEFIFVDPEVICSATRWLMTMQRPDGGFRENYLVHHKEMTGGVSGGDASFTAFVLIALQECDCSTPEMTTAILSSVMYLEDQLAELERPYAVAIVAYALALMNSDKKFEANEKLKALSVFDPLKNMRYWNVDDSSFGNGDKPYWYARKPSAIAVETTAYALLTQLKLDNIKYANPIVVWLTKQRNAQGGFVSTQDTVLALQALSQYTRQTQTADLDLTCQLTSESDPNFEEQFLIQTHNALLQQQAEVPVVGQLYIDTSGTGVGQVQVEVRYNTPISDADRCAFEINVQSAEPRLGRILDLNGVIDRSRVGFGRSRVGRQADDARSDYSVTINACARYLKEGNAGMSIIDVGLFTGFKPVKSDLDELLNNVESPVQRYEITDRSVIIYVDEIPSDSRVCVEFRAKQEYKVGQVQPVAVHVYDYYAPDNECTKFYRPAEGSALLATLCVGETCVCAEGKCGTCALTYLSRRELEEKACSEMDYVFEIRVTDISDEAGFQVITAEVERPVKVGLDVVVGGEKRTFWKSASCPCPSFEIDERYLVMGPDGLPSVDKEGVESYKYVIGSQSLVEWFPSGDKLRRRKWRRILQNIGTFTDRLSAQGCIH